jgi:YHS domain-containing protein
MKVDRTKAVTKQFGDETFYFCSDHCLHAFELEPQRYAAARPGRTAPGNLPSIRVLP